MANHVKVQSDKIKMVNTYGLTEDQFTELDKAAFENLSSLEVPIERFVNCKDILIAHDSLFVNEKYSVGFSATSSRDA